MKSSRSISAGGEEKEGEHVSISKTWLQKLLDVETAGLLHRTSQAKMSLIMRCIHISSLPDLLDRSWTQTSWCEMKLYFIFSTVTWFLNLLIHWTKDAWVNAFHIPLKIAAGSCTYATKAASAPPPHTTVTGSQELGWKFDRSDENTSDVCIHRYGVIFYIWKESIVSAFNSQEVMFQVFRMDSFAVSLEQGTQFFFSERRKTGEETIVLCAFLKCIARHSLTLSHSTPSLNQLQYFQSV